MLRENQELFITKQLNMAIMTRSKLRNLKWSSRNGSQDKKFLSIKERKKNRYQTKKIY